MLKQRERRLRTEPVMGSFSSVAYVERLEKAESGDIKLTSIIFGIDLFAAFRGCLLNA